MDQNSKPTGLTRDTGWQCGARRTFEIAVPAAWDLLFSPPGVALWLGDIGAADLELGAEVTSAEGVTAKITTLKPESHLRMQWRRAGWKNVSMLQIRVIPAKAKTTVSFAHQKLANQAQRAEMVAHWQEALEKIARLIG